MTGAGRIDVHQHVISPWYRAWLHENGRGEPAGDRLPAWSVEGCLATLDTNGIATALVSVPTPGTHLGDGVAAAVAARRVNEFSAELAKDRPDRFGFLASAPLPDVDAAAEAATYALDELGADGLMLLANVEGRYLGDPGFDPLLAELDRRSALVLVHPASLPGPEVPGLGPPAGDYMLDTTRAAINLVRVRATGRFPRIRWVLAHAGGFLPYQSHRIAGWLATYAYPEPSYHAAPDAEKEAVGERALGRMPGLLDELRSFYFDVALSSTSATLPTLLAFAKPGHVLFGSDWPFVPESAVGYFVGELEGYEPLGAVERHALDRGNAEALLPRLAQFG